MEEVDSLNHKSVRVEVEVRTGITIKDIIKTDIDQITGQIVETGDNTGNTEIGPGTNKIIGEVNLEKTEGAIACKMIEKNIEITLGMIFMIEAGTGPEMGHLPEIMAIIGLEVQATVVPGQDPELT